MLSLDSWKDKERVDELNLSLDAQCTMHRGDINANSANLALRARTIQ